MEENILITPRMVRRITLQREIAISLCGALLVLLAVSFYQLTCARVDAHMLRANLAASCAVNPVPPQYWQPEFRHE